MTKLFVGSLPYSTTNDELMDMFAAFGKVAQATVVTDRMTGRSKGFGFVEMDDEEDAEKAIKDLNGSTVGGRTIVVSVARPREERPDRGNFRRDDRRGGDRRHN